MKIIFTARKQNRNIPDYFPKSLGKSILNSGDQDLKNKLIKLI
jgi:hypothetical protein